jgi:hypothetical protein
METIDTTFCGHCHEEKLMEEFAWENKAKGTLSSRCKACCKQENRAYNQTPKGKAIKAINNQTPKAKAARTAYTKTPKGKAIKAAWEKTPKAKATKAVYAKTPKRKASEAVYRKNNPGIINALRAKRKAAKLQRTPKWAEPEKEAIRIFYENCPEGMEVDHDIPLQGKLVSGLHVLSNLRYLTPEANRKKGNKFDPIAFNNLKKNKE